MLAIKGFTAKKPVILNDNELRPVPIPTDFAHLMIRKIDEAYIEFIQSSKSTRRNVRIYIKIQIARSQTFK